MILKSQIYKTFIDLGGEKEGSFSEHLLCIR